MPYPAFTGGVANIFPAAFQAVYIRAGAAEKWQTLGDISGGVLNIKDFSSNDSLGRNKAINSYDATGKCAMMQSSSVELLLLAAITNGTNDFLFKLSDAVTPAGAASAGWVYYDHAQVGCKGKVVADGEPEKNRVIELEWQGSIFKSDANEVSLMKPTLAAADFEATGSGGTYHAIGLYTAATDGGSPNNTHLSPCGVASITLDLAGGASPVNMTPIMGVKLAFEALTAQDGLRRFLPNSLDIAMEWDWMASANADLLLLGNGTVVDVKLVVTMIDAVVFTLNNQVGIEFNFEVSGDMDKPRIVRFVHKGKILRSTFASIVS